MADNRKFWEGLEEQRKRLEEDLKRQRLEEDLKRQELKERRKRLEAQRKQMVEEAKTLKKQEKYSEAARLFQNAAELSKDLTDKARAMKFAAKAKNMQEFGNNQYHSQ